MRRLSSLRVLFSALVAVTASTAQAGTYSDSIQSGGPSFEETPSLIDGSTIHLVSAETADDQRLATIESRLSMIESATGADSRSCRSQVIPSTHLSTNSIGCPRNYGGFDFAILQANVGGISGSIPPLGVSGTVTPTFNLDLAPRIYFGRERADGLGARLTYFHYDHSTGPSQLGVDTHLQVQSLDVEATNRIQFYNSDLLLSAGFRYGKLMQSYQLAGLGSLDFDSEGGGLTIGGRYTRGLGNTRWNMFIGGRGSILLTDNEIQVPGLISIVGEESTMKVWEGQVGVGRTFEVSNRVNLLTEVSFEAQNWDAAPIAGLIGNDISLFGPTFRIGMDF